MSRRLVSTNSFNAVAPGQIATLDLPVGDQVYHEIRLAYDTATAGGASQANVEAEIERVRLMVDGKAQLELTAEQLIDLSTFYGRPFRTGAASFPASLPIVLAPLGRKTRSAQGEDALAWGTADVSSLQVEVKIASGATSPVLSAKVVVDDIRRPMGPIVKWRPVTIPVTATGVTSITTFPRNDDYFAINCFSANILDVEVKLDQREMFKATLRELEYLLADNGYTWVSGLVPVRFDIAQRVADALKMRRPNGRPISEFRVDFNMGSASSFAAILETVGLRD